MYMYIFEYFGSSPSLIQLWLNFTPSFLLVFPTFKTASYVQMLFDLWAGRWYVYIIYIYIYTVDFIVIKYIINNNNTIKQF